jgi:NADPH:quinone reductase-like Zn-dependent oxidoreductase
MRAASLNHRDWLVATGKYDPRFRLPLVLASDGVGEVIEVGQDVQRVRVGDRVCPIFAQGWLTGDPDRATLATALGGPLDGTLVERMVVPEESVVIAPRHLSDGEAACLPCAAVTAWRAVVTLGHVSPGHTVLTQGTGGVSLFALQFAKLAGARVIVTSRSDSKLARAVELGADDTINYERDPRWGDTARKLTAGRGVDLVVDVVGGATLAQSLRAVRVGGCVMLVGNLADTGEHPTLLPAVMRQVRLQGVLVGSRQDFEAMNQAIERSGLRPVLARVFAMDDVQSAFSELASAHHFGKLVVDLA